MLKRRPWALPALVRTMGARLHPAAAGPPHPFLRTLRVTRSGSR
jgi:hypothetical protein